MSVYTEIKKYINYPGRNISNINDQTEFTKHNVDALRKNGYLILEDFISSDLLGYLQSRVTLELESNFGFEYPCLSQKKIDEEKHKELINNYLRYTPKDLKKYGLTFDFSDVTSYNQILEEFNPSTIKLLIPNDISFFNLWLNPILLEIVEAYLGLKPFLLEAYIRRNFPAKYRVMNHFWHRDINHESYLVKIFFFLSDCALENGPHEYISGSIDDRTLDGKLYYTDEEIDKTYPEGSKRRIKSIVKAGTIVIEDTRGLHRAVVPQKGYRDLGYAVFMPHEIFTRWGDPEYCINKDTYLKLNPNQRSYIPSKNKL